MLRGARAVEVLEGIGTPEARKVLAALAGGPATRLTREARAAAARLDRLEAAAKRGLKIASGPRDPFGDPLPSGVLARLGTTRLRHGAAVDALAFSPDGRVLAAGSADGTIRWHDPATGKRLLGVGHDGQHIQVLTFAPDGKTLASAGWNGGICLWNVTSGRLVRRLGDRHGSGAHALQFSEGGEHLLAADRDGYINSWEVATNKRQHSFRVQVEAWFRGSFAADGKLASCSGRDHTLSLREVATGREVLKLPAHKDYVYAAVFSPDGRYLASGGRTNALHLWELATGQLVYTLSTNDHILAFSPDGRTLASAGDYGGGITLWDIPAGKERRRLLGHETAVRGLAFTPDGRALASGSADNTVLLWDVRPWYVLNGGKPGPKLADADLPGCWKALAGEDAAAAQQAVGRLAQHPAVSIPFLRERLKPTAAAPAERLRALIAALDAREFAAREKARDKLKRLGELAEPALRQALKGNLSLEARRRIQGLLAGLGNREIRVARGERLRLLRAIQVLETDGSREARAVLERLAQGAPQAAATQASRAAVRRLTRKFEGLEQK